MLHKETTAAFRPEGGTGTPTVGPHAPPGTSGRVLVAPSRPARSASSTRTCGSSRNPVGERPTDCFARGRTARPGASFPGSARARCAPGSIVISGPASRVHATAAATTRERGTTVWSKHLFESSEAVDQAVIAAIEREVLDRAAKRVLFDRAARILRRPPRSRPSGSSSSRPTSPGPPRACEPRAHARGHGAVPVDRRAPARPKTRRSLPLGRTRWPAAPSRRRRSSMSGVSTGSSRSTSASPARSARR